MNLTPSVPRRKPRPRMWNMLAAKVAFPVAVAAAVAAAFSGWLAAVVAGIVAGVTAYAAVSLMVARRLELARQTLRQIRRHRFDNLSATDLGRGDELNDLIRQVYRTGRVLETEIEELNNLESYRREFVGNVSHELKTPIFAIRGFAETLMDGALDDPEVNRAFMEKIVRNADRLSNLARDLSEISKLETGQQQVEAEPFDLRRLTADVVESVESIAARKNITLSVSVGDDVPPVSGDPARIRQVFVNLVDNAIKYTNEGGRITVSAVLRDDDYVAISVEDNGIGIAPEDLPRLTERFFRVDKSRSRSAGGTGLGLSIVKHILAAHDQVLRVESRVGAGSRFGFRLPVAPEDDLEGA